MNRLSSLLLETSVVVCVRVAAPVARLDPRRAGAELLACSCRATLVPCSCSVVFVERVSRLLLLVVEVLQAPHLAIPTSDLELILSHDGLPTASRLRLGHREDSALRPQLAPVVQRNWASVRVDDDRHA